MMALPPAMLNPGALPRDPAAPLDTRHEAMSTPMLPQPTNWLEQLKASGNPGAQPGKIEGVGGMQASGPPGQQDLSEVFKAMQGSGNGFAGMMGQFLGGMPGQGGQGAGGGFGGMMGQPGGSFNPLALFSQLMNGPMGNSGVYSGMTRVS